MENENPFPKVKIITNDDSTTHVFLDGKEVPGIVKMEYIADPQISRIPKLKLTLVSDVLEIDGFCTPELPDFYKDIYEKKKD
jgi:hypothetical protein